VCKDPRNRHNPAKTSSFISEVKIVLDSLERQQVVVDEFYLEQFFTRVGARHSTSTNSIQPRNPTHLLLQDALDGLRGKITSVQELLEKAEKLLELVSLIPTKSRPRTLILTQRFRTQMQSGIIKTSRTLQFISSRS
jgi:hypothetical protein